MVTLNPNAEGFQNINLLQPSGFKLSIRRDQYPNLDYFVQSVQHPGMALPAAEVAYQRIAPGVPMPGDKLSFGELSCMVIADEELNGYNEYYKWMKRLVEEDYVAPDGPYTRDREKISSHADVSLSFLSSHNNKTKRIVYRHCVPTSLGDLSMDASQAGTSYIVYPISLRFAYFDIED